MESTKQGRHTRDIENWWRCSQPDGEAGTPLEQDRDEFGDRGEGRSQGVSPIPQGDTAVPLVFASSNNSDLPHRGGRKQNRCGWLTDHLAEQVTENRSQETLSFQQCGFLRMDLHYWGEGEERKEKDTDKIN